MTDTDLYAVEAAIAVLNDRGFNIASPRDGDLDDLEQERFNAITDGCRAYLSAVGGEAGETVGTLEVVTKQFDEALRRQQELEREITGLRNSYAEERRQHLSAESELARLKAQPGGTDLLIVLADAVHDRCFGIASLKDPNLALAEISDGGGIHEAVHQLLRALPACSEPVSQPANPAQGVSENAVEAAQKILERHIYDEGGVIGEEVAAMVREMLTAAIGAGGQAAVATLKAELDWYSRTEHGALDGIPFPHVAHVIRVMLNRIASASPQSITEGEPSDAEGWRSMGSAPKDGENILYCTRFEDIGFCHWDEGYNGEDQPCWWDNERDDEVCPIAWLPADTLPSLTAAKAGEDGR